MQKQQIYQLRKQAHKLKPVVIVGAKQLTPAVDAEIETALLAHQLIKIKVNAEDRDARKVMADNICQQHAATLIQSVGNMVTIYRESTD
jgi:RNA-binding protein